MMNFMMCNGLPVAVATVDGGVVTESGRMVFDGEMQLSEHFRLCEFTRSGAAIRHGLENVPDALAVVNLRLLCENVLEPLRRRFGVIRITSGYRSKAVNDLVGGVEFSQHRFGQAADIHVSNGEVGKKMFEFLKENVVFDQLIYEYASMTGKHWLHVSFKLEGNRRQAFMNYRM